MAKVTKSFKIEDGKLPPVHPGDVLLEEFMKPAEITAYQIAKATGLSQTQVGDIVRRERSITAATALRLEAFLGTSARFWLNLQVQYDLEVAKNKIGKELSQIKLSSKIDNELVSV